MQSDTAFVLLNNYPYGSAVVVLLLIVAVLSCLIAAYVCAPILREARRERRKQRFHKDASIPVWLGRPSI